MALSPHVPDLDALELLLEVARTGSLNAAARHVGISQQAASARIRGMEGQTGVILLRRTPRGSQLTGEGAVVAEWAGRLLDIAAEMETGLAALRRDRRTRLRVSASSTIAEQLLPSWLASFRLTAQPASPAPEIVLTAANTRSVITDVSEGRADLGFIEGTGQPRSLQGSRPRLAGRRRRPRPSLGATPPPGQRCRAEQHPAGEPGRRFRHQGHAVGSADRGARCPHRAAPGCDVGVDHRRGPRGRAGWRRSGGHQRTRRR